MRDGKGIHVQHVPGTYRPLANKDNDYLMDRAAQREGRTFSGIEGFAMQDASLQESMGPIVDRTKETLVSTDSGIIMARQRLLRALRALEGSGTTPPGVDPAHQRQIRLPGAAARSRSRMRRARPHRASRCRAGHGVTQFRIEAQPPTGRVIGRSISTPPMSTRSRIWFPA